VATSSTASFWPFFPRVGAGLAGAFFFASAIAPAFLIAGPLVFWDVAAGVSGSGAVSFWIASRASGRADGRVRETNARDRREDRGSRARI
jgi:hypothetical protein